MTKSKSDAGPVLSQRWMLASMAHLRVRAQMGRRRRSEGLIDRHRHIEGAGKGR